MAWAKNGTPITLGSAADDLDITDLTAFKFNQFLTHAITTGDSNLTYTFDNNANTDYAVRQSTNGAADGTSVNQTGFSTKSNNTGDYFGVMYSLNISAEEKLFINMGMESVGSGAAQAPARRELVAKVDTTTNSGQYTRIDLHNSATGSYDTDSNLSALSTD